MSEEIIKVNINEKAVTESISDEASVFASDNGRLLRVPISAIHDRNMKFCGDIISLPKDSKVGDVYRIVSQGVSLGKLSIIVSGIRSFTRNPVDEWGDSYSGYTQIDIDVNSPLYSFFAYAKFGVTMDYGGEYSSFIKSPEGDVYSVYCKDIAFGKDYDDVMIRTDPYLEGHLENGKALICYSDDMSYLPDELKPYLVRCKYGDYCIYTLNGWEKLPEAFSCDAYGNVTSGNNESVCMAYYIKSIDIENKKIYLTDKKVVPVISTVDNTDSSFKTPEYEVGDGFSIVNKNHYNNCGTIASVVNNVVTYSEDSLGFTVINEDTDGGIADYTFRVWGKPDIGVVAVTKFAFATGYGNKALGSFSAAEGGGNVADGFYAHVEGLNNYAAYGAHAEGNGNKAIGNESHVEGHSTTATGGNAHAEGQNTVAKGGGSHAEGMGTQAIGSQSHSEGLNTVAKGAHSHVEGANTQADSFTSHAEGNGTIASAKMAHAEGYGTVASGESSHAEGQQTEASGNFTHAQGIRSYAKGYAAFASGADVEASGDVAVAMGKSAKATARASLAVGENVTASGEKSVALGLGTTAKQQGQIAVGMYNADDADAVFIVGGGTASARKNVFAVKKDGRIFAGGAEFSLGGTFRKIGFTSDCDYAATSSDGYTAFNTALSEASEGDIILVMPGTYKSAAQLRITKDITFIGIGRPVIDFPVYTQGGGSFNYETWSWDTIYESKHSKWYSFVFNKNFSVGCEADPDGVEYHGNATAVDCTFNGSVNIVGTFIGCTFNGGCTSGHYYGGSSNFENCKFIESVYFYSGYDTCIGCEFYPSTGYLGDISSGGNNFKGCKIYAPGVDVSVSDSHVAYLYLDDTVIFAKSITQSSLGIIGGFLVSCTAL